MLEDDTKYNTTHFLSQEAAFPNGCLQICRLHVYDVMYTFFYRQLHFLSQPGVANGFWENEAESCLVVA